MNFQSKTIPISISLCAPAAPFASPNRQYLPPSSGQQPSSQYGPPNQGGGAGGAGGSGGFGGNQGGFGGSGSFGQPPSNQYGPPSQGNFLLMKRKTIRKNMTILYSLCISCNNSVVCTLFYAKYLMISLANNHCFLEH